MPQKRLAGRRVAATASILAALLLAGILGWIVIRAGRQSAPPARCSAGFEARGARCCAQGQRLQGGECLGQPVRCPDSHERREDGCVARPLRIRIGPGQARIGPGDWEAQGVVKPTVIVIEAPFWLDATEVTMDRWGGCVRAGVCERIDGSEPGIPARGITFAQAEAFCRWAGGEIPTEDEWVYAAAGPKARRYPWGDTGGVCRRGAWGLARGPCATGGVGPDIAGIHPDGASPEGVQDLAGSVAEWVVSRSGAPSTRGGSWRSALATELRTWRDEQRNPGQRWDDVGVRCRYAVGESP